MPDSLAPIASKPEESMASVAKERPAEQDSTHDESMQEAVEESTNAMNVDSPSKTDPQVNATIEKESKQQGEKQVENKAQEEEEEESETSREVGQQDYTPIVESSAERVARQQSLHDILDILIIRSKPLLNKQQQQQQQQSDDNNIPVTLEEIKDRLSKGEYDTEKKITTQLILNDVCQYYNHQSTLSHWSAKDRTAIEELRDLGRALLQRIGADHPSWRKRSLNENDDNSNDHMQVENETENNNDNTEDVNSVDESAQRPTKVALYQRGTDAYLFSGTSTLNAIKNDKDDLSVNVGEIRKISILPTPSLSKVPTMGQAVGPAVQPPITSLHRYRDWSAHRIQPVAFLDYGPYSSFAPSYDINMANLSSSESARIALYKQQQRQQQQQRRKQEQQTAEAKEKLRTNDTSTRDDTANAVITKDDIDHDLFKRHNIDIDMLTRLEAELAEAESRNTGVAITATVNDNSNPEIEAILLKNAGLLLELQVLQEERFASEYKSPKTVSELERQLARTLEQNLAGLAEKTAPRTLITASNTENEEEDDTTVSTIIESAMARLPHAIPAYRGTLPPNRPFAYGSNYGSRMVHPPAATVVPGTRSDANNAAQIQQHLLLQRQLQAGNPALNNAPTTPISYAAGNRSAMTTPSMPINMAALQQQQQRQQQQQQQQQAMATTMMMMQGNNATRCLNCGTADSSTWRAMPGANSTAKLCNACGLYYVKYQHHRPVERWANRTTNHQ